MKPLRPIRSEDDHKEALAEIRSLWDAKPGTDRGDRFEILSMLVDAYERRHVPISPPDPLDAIAFRLEQMGMTHAELETLLGGPTLTSEVLARKRSLSVAMIRTLHEVLGIELSVLIQPTVQEDGQRSESRA